MDTVCETPVMVNRLVLVADEHGVLRDQDGHARNRSGEKNDEEGVRIHGVIVVAKNVGKLWSCSTENTWRLKHT